MRVCLEYIAGFIDGEGCFCIHHHKNRYAGIFSISNTDEHVLKVIGLTLAKQGIVISIQKYESNVNKWKNSYTLRIGRVDSIGKLCKVLKGKLVLKDKHRILMSHFIDVKERMGDRRGRGVGYTDDELEELASYCSQMKALNKTGK